MTKQFHPVRYLPRLDIKLSNGVELFNGVNDNIILLKSACMAESACVVRERERERVISDF